MSVSAVRFYELFNSIGLHLGQNKNTATELKKETFAFGSATTYVVNRNIPVFNYSLLHFNLFILLISRVCLYDTLQL